MKNLVLHHVKLGTSPYIVECSDWVFILFYLVINSILLALYTFMRCFFTILYMVNYHGLLPTVKVSTTHEPTKHHISANPFMIYTLFVHNSKKKFGQAHWPLLKFSKLS